MSTVALTAPLARTSRPTGSSFIVSPGFDALFFLGSSLVVLLPWLASERFHVASWYILAAVGIFSNGPHLSSTWTRVYLDRSALRRHPVHYVGVPLAIGAFVTTMVLLQGAGSIVIRSILFYYATYHFAQQNWGLLRIYQRKQGEQSIALVRLERAAIYLGAGWCALHRLFTGPWLLFGGPVWHPAPPPWLVNGALALLVTAGCAIVLVRLMRAVRGEGLELLRPLFLLSNLFGFLVPFLFIRADGTSAFAAAACWHGVQYIGIVYYFNRRKYLGRVDAEARLVSFVSQPRRAPLYALLLLALAGLAYALLLGGAALTGMTADSFGVLGWTTLTFAHYYLDGVIWKLRQSENARPLGLEPSPAAS